MLSRRGRNPGIASPSGVSLIELLIVLVLLGLVAGMTVRMVTKQQRFYAGVAEITNTRSNLRELSAILPTDLRGVSSAGGDIYAMSDSSIDFRLPAGHAVICTINAGGLSATVAPLQLGSRSAVTSWLTPPQAGDSIFVYDEGPTGIVADDSWKPNTLLIGPTPASTCPTASGFTTTGSEQSSGFTLTFGTALPLTTPVGSVIRLFRRAHYGFAKRGADWFLTYFDCPAGVCNAASPTAGPFRPYDAVFGGSGIQFRYLDSAGVATTIPAQVARIDIIARGQTRAPVALADGARAVVQDSLLFTTALRNRK